MAGGKMVVAYLALSTMTHGAAEIKLIGLE